MKLTATSVLRYSRLLPIHDGWGSDGAVSLAASMNEAPRLKDVAPRYDAAQIRILT